MSKILHVLADSSLGGGLTHVIQVLNLVGSTKKYELVLLLNQCDHISSIRSQLPESIEIIECPFFQAKDFFANFLSLHRKLISLECDLVHCHGGRSVFWISLLNFSTPILYTVHGLHFVSRSGFSRHLGACIEWWNIKRSSYTIFVSNYDRQNAQRWHLLGNTRNVVIHNGIDHRIFGGNVSEALPENVKTPANSLDSRKWNITYVGRLESVKDPLLFLRIVELLPEANAILVGDGSLRNQVKDIVEEIQIHERIYLTGAISRSKALNLMSQSSIIVMTSHREGLPMVALEAMALGIPIVASAVGGIPELIVNGETGFLIDSRDPRLYANAIRRIILNPSLYKQMRQAAIARVRKLFSEESMIASILKVYQSCLDI